MGKIPPPGELDPALGGAWKRIVDAEPSPICAFDHEFRITAFNIAHSDQFFGIYAHRVQIGEIFPDLFLPEQGSIIRGFMARALAGEVFEVVEEFGNPDLSKPFWSISYAPLRDDSGTIIGAFHRARDISKQLRSEAELAAAKQALQQTELRNWHLGRTLALFDDQARDLADVDGISKLAAKIVGQTLNSDAVGFGTLQPDGNTVDFDRVWNAPKIPVLLPGHSTVDVGAHLDALSRAEDAAQDDMATDPGTDSVIQAWSALGARSAITIPLLDAGRLAHLFAVLAVEHRVWDRSEVEFVRTIANRLRVHIARIRDEDSHRAAAAQLAEEVRLRTNQLELTAQALNDSQDFARLALTAVGGVGVWTYDAIADRFFYDGAIAKLYDLDPGQGEAGLTTAGFLQNVHPADREALAATMAGGLLNPGQLELEYRLRHSDGSVHWVLSRGHTYFDESGRAVRRTGIGIDMTKQRLLEEQLRQSQKMEAVGQLTGGLAHDFNNLLAGITGSLELLQNRVSQGNVTSIDRYVVAAQGAARRAAALTHRLLAFSRRQTLDPKSTDVNDLVRDMVDLIRRTVGPQIDIEVVGAKDLWPTLVDSNQLENALLNLCINARDAMPDGGRITIESANDTFDARSAAELDITPGQYVSLSVTDTGSGMTAEVMRRAFDPFFTTKPLGQGTGLGLSMIYGFVRQSGGQVSIRSEVGMGTSLCLYFPRDYQAPDATVGIEAPQGLDKHGAGQVVLVVDDEPTIRLIVVEILVDCGYVAVEATDGPSSLELLRSNARIDLLITDVGLPGGMNGRQIADAARVLRPSLKVLFITGYAESSVIGNGNLEPGMEVVTKPFAMDALSQRIRRMLQN